MRHAMGMEGEWKMRRLGGSARPGSRWAGMVVLMPVLIAGVAQAQEPSSGPDPVEPYISYTQFTLENGLTVLVHSDRSLPVVSVNVWYHVGSGNEKPGRTGFAHLFEHIMFEGSANVPEGDFDNLLEAAGGVNNGSTNNDRTNYYENVPSGALELALWLEADRMGWLLDTMDQTKLDLQRDIVKNERRQSYENRPYGLASETILHALFPPDHPYHWSVIGSMEDLSAASLEDVTEFFRTYYAPNNASIAIAGDVSVSRARTLAEKYFGEIPSGPTVPAIEAPDPTLNEEIRLVMEDDVQLPRLYMTWHSPAAYSQDEAPMDLAATVLSDGRNSRLQRRLVFEEQVAQDVFAYQSGRRLGGTFHIVATAKPGVDLATLEAAIREEMTRMVEEGVQARELERAIAQIETGFVQQLERVGGFGGRANMLNQYFFFTGDPGFVRKDLARYRAAGPEDVAAGAGRYLLRAHPVVLSVVPRGATDLAASDSREVVR
jgi:zinc protease